LEERLRDAAERRWGLGHAKAPSAFRLANEAGDGLAGVAIDVYGTHLLVHLYSPEAEACRERILDAAFFLGPSSVYVKTHPKQANTLVDTHKDSLAPSHALRGEDAPDPLVICESGLSYRVRLGDGLKTGIFLDQRENRRVVRSLSEGKRVLNLFAYTCAFTVAAAAGAATSTVSVDVSPGTLAWGRENLEQNGLLEGRHEFVHADVFAWLKDAKRRSATFDLVILDPPSYATTHRSRFSAESDYHALAAEALALVAPGGRLLACTNHRGITRAKFRRALHQAGREAGRELVQVKDLPDPEDFPPPYGAEPHLKSVLVTAA
jgi:23S rRNA (cytosine1962-C5)-methyltransferase